MAKFSDANDQTRQSNCQILSHTTEVKNKFKDKDEDQKHSTETEEDSSVLNFLSKEYFDIEKKLKSL